MIESLYQINSALVNLSQQLSNKQTTNQTIKKCIHNLVQQVRFLDEKERYHYYLLISQIYATRFQNIQDAAAELRQFGKTLDSQISMNCELRIAFFHYFQLNYKEAFKHLDLALGQVEEELKLIDNAKFFFNRVLNKQFLISESKDKLNFQSGFILSLIYENQKQHIQALKQIQSFLDLSNDSFRKFQIYKRLLELYESMTKNSISTISISKKSLETHRQDLIAIQNKFPQFQQNYQYKCKFANRVINFINSGQTQNNEKLIRKMLDFKLLAYYKLKKCSKHAPSMQIKRTLQNTAKLIKSSKSTELLENILNYDFIKKQYQIFKVFYKPSIMKKLFNLKFFTCLSNCQLGKMQTPAQSSFFKEPAETGMMNQRSLFSKKSKRIQFQSQYEASPPISSSKYTQRQKQQQPQLYTFKPNNSILKSTSKMKNTANDTIQIKQTQSDILNVDDFQGSKMYKFNATSSGHEERYFYINPQKIGDKPKLYFCMNKNNKSSSDSSYSLKGLKKVLVGKQTDTLKRKEAQKYNDSQCFALIFEDGKDRSFYVPNQEDLQKWVLLLQTKVLYTDSNVDKMTRTMNFKQDESKNSNMNRSSPQVKKSRIKFDI